jgi:hypothetical protein
LAYAPQKVQRTAPLRPGRLPDTVKATNLFERFQLLLSFNQPIFQWPEGDLKIFLVLAQVNVAHNKSGAPAIGFPQILQWYRDRYC